MLGRNLSSLVSLSARARPCGFARALTTLTAGALPPTGGSHQQLVAAARASHHGRGRRALPSGVGAGAALALLLLGGGGSALCATEESDMLIFTGNANAELATEIAALLGAQLGAITVSRFACVRGVDGGGGKGLLALGELSKGCAFFSPPASLPPAMAR